MATINFGGIESGDLSEFSASNGTVSVDSSTVRTGGYSLKCNPTGTGTGRVNIQALSAAGASTGASVVTSYIRFYFRAATLPATNDEYIVVVRESGGNKFFVSIASDGKLAAYDSTATLLATGTTVLSTGVWYRIEIKCGTGASAAWEVKIDGTSEISGTGNLSTSNGNHIRLGKAANRNGNSVEFYYDDWIWSDSAYPGVGECQMMQPDGNGNYTAWTGTYTDVDEVTHDSDTTYISTSTNGAAETVTLESAASAGITGTPNSVKSWAMVRDASGIAGTAFQVRLRSGSTDNDTNSTTPGSTYELRAKIYDTDPADAGAWTLADLDSLEVGVEANAVTAHRCTQLCVMVDYTPSVGAAAMNGPFDGGLFRGMTMGGRAFQC